MEVHLPADKEAQFIQLATAQGRDADLLAQEVLGNYLQHEAEIIAAIEAGEADFANGNYVPHEEVVGWLNRLPKP